MSFDIQNKTTVITGANRGIGKAIAETFLQHGAKKVYLAVRDTASVAAFVAGYAGKVEAVQVDMTRPGTIAALAAKTPDADILVNNAGILEPANALSEHAEAALRQELEVNTFGLLRIAQAFAPVLEKNGGVLVQINSVASINNFSDITTYSASKAASYSITQGLKELLQPKGVTVLSVHPGPIVTDMTKKIGMDEIGEPASVVAEGIVSALKAGDFHLFPDAIARNFGAAYQSYADTIIEAEPDHA